MKQQFIFGILMFALTAFACKEKNKSADPSVSEHKNDGSGNNDFQINTQQSIVKWIGSKPAGKHIGTVPVGGGSVIVEGGVVTGGTIMIDMTNIKVQDPSGEMGANLEAHLKGTAPGKEEDFFNVGKFPNATYTITSSSVLTNDPSGTHMINDDYTTMIVKFK